MQIAFAAAGATVGFFLGGPTGAQIGWFAGSLLGAALDPQRTQGPKLPDLRVQGSSYGAPIPFIWPGEGIRVGGNVVWKTDLVAHEQTTSAKGGPEVTSTTYTMSLRISFGKTFGDNVSIGRVWKNNRLVDDFRQGSSVEEHLPLVFYDGNPEQLPDPTEEAIEGVGMVPAYRGVASVVLTDVACESNVPDQYNFELIADETHDDKPIEIVLQNNNPSVPHQNWGTPTGHPSFSAFPVITQWPLESGDAAARIRVLEANAELTVTPDVFTVHTYNADTGAYIGSELATGSERFPHDIGHAGDLVYSGVGWYEYADGTRVKLWASLGHLLVNGSASGGLQTGPPLIYGDAPDLSMWPAVSGNDFLIGSGIPLTHRVEWVVPSTNGKCLLVLTQSAPGVGGADKWYRVINGLVASSGTCNPVNTFGPNVAPVARNPNLIGGMLENNYQYLWVGANNTHNCAVYWINEDDVFELAPVHTVGPSGLALPGDTGDLGSGYQYLMGIYALPGGCRCGIVFGYSVYLVERCTITPGHLLLSEVVDDVCDESDMTDGERDVDAIPIPMHAFLVDRTPITGRAILETVLPVYFADGRDRDGVAVFTPRGRQPDVTVPRGDLIVRSEGEGLAPRLRTVTGNYSELPRQIFFSYINPRADYLTGSQQWQRMTGGSKDARSIGVAVVLYDEEAKRVVDMWGESLWTEADKHSYVVSRKYLDYEGTDVMIVEGVPIRVEKKTEGIRGELTFEGVRNDPGLIAQQGVPGDSGGGFVPPEIPVPQETYLRVIDGPFPQEGHEGQIQVVMQGALRPVPAADLYKSVDAGANWTRVLSSTTRGTTGEALTALPAFRGGNVLDTLSRGTLIVYRGGGDLASVTVEQAELGANLMMWGAEACAPLDVDLVSETDEGKIYECNRFLRGLNGTEWAMFAHQGRGDSPPTSGDLVTLMSTAVPLDIPFAEYGHTVLYKPVTAGRSLTTATALEFTSNGISRQPWSPVHLRIGKTVAGDFIMSCIERMRLNNAWLDFVDVPRDEPTEKFRFRIWEDGSFQTVKREIIVTGGAALDVTAGTFISGTPKAFYTGAQQTTDFGGLLGPDPAWSVAKWGALGWGYETLSSGGWAALPVFTPADVPEAIPPNPAPALGIETHMPWGPPPVRQFSGAMVPTDQWHVRVTSGNTDSTGLVTLSGAEWLSDGGAPCTHEWCFSPVRGDFAAAYPGATSVSKGSSVSVFAQFAVGSGPATFSGVTYPTMPKLATWWLNIRHGQTTAVNVAMFMDLINSPGP